MGPQAAAAGLPGDDTEYVRTMDAHHEFLHNTNKLAAGNLSQAGGGRVAGGAVGRHQNPAFVTLFTVVTDGLGFAESVAGGATVCRTPAGTAVPTLVAGDGSAIAAIALGGQQEPEPATPLPPADYANAALVSSVRPAHRPPPHVPAPPSATVAQRIASLCCRWRATRRRLAWLLAP